MKIKLLCAGLMFSSLVMAKGNVAPPKSVSVINLSGNVVDLWINGEYRELKAGVAVLQPCLPGEEVEVQAGMDLTYIQCGEIMEIAE